MSVRRSASTWLLAPCLALGACGGNSTGSTGSNGGFSSSGSQSSSGSNGSSSGYTSSSSGSYPTSSGASSSGSSILGGSSSGSGGDDSGGGSSSGSSSGASGSSSGGSSGGSSGTGPAPTSDSASKQGSCTVQSYTNGVPAGQDYVNPTVYYATNCPGPFPGVVVAPGFTEAQGAINQWGTFLASHGFVVMMVDTASGGVANTGIAPAQRELTLMEGVATLKAENSRSGSPVAGQVNVALMAVMGHSMGGGGTLIAATDHSELKAAVGLCPWNASINYAADAVPSLLFTGTADGLVSVGTGGMGPNEFASIPNTTHKMYSEFTGGTHFVANTPLGTAATDKAVARFGLSWLEIFEVGDTRYQQFLVKDATNSVFTLNP